MTKSCRPRAMARRWVVLLGFAIGNLGPVWAADYAGLVEQARDQLQNERFIEALAAAKDAVRANANDYKGHYYVAMAYMGMNRFDDAETAVTRALSLAPAGAKPGVEKLVDVIKTRRQGAGSLQAADAALADGLASKAARLYEQAWNAGQDDPEPGFKAADLYANRLSQPVDAGRVLRQVKAALKGSPVAAKAEAELNKLSGPLRQIAQGYVKTAGSEKGADALRSLQQAEEADPSFLDIYPLRAKIVAQDGTLDALQNAIKDLAKRDRATLNILAGLPRMVQWMEQPAFNEFLSDLLGSGQIEKLQKLARTPPSEIAQRQIFRDCPTCPEMVVIPSGSFDMGSSNGEDNELPVHTVTISQPFAMSVTEVTFADYDRFAVATSRDKPGDRSWGRGDRPVMDVSWADAVAYAKWLSVQTGKRYRLPSEAEWEYAARAETTTAYWWGEEVGHNNANCDGCGSQWDKQQTAPVKSFKPNAFGLYDMAGNVKEMTADCWNENYSGAPADGTAWTGGDCGSRVVRGGSWKYLPVGVRSARRVGFPPENGFDTLGFRLAQDL